MITRRSLPRRLSCLLPLTAAIAFAQLSTLVPLASGGSQLAVTDDGKQIYFTSGLLLKGAPAGPAPSTADFRIYRAGPDGVTLYAERGPLASTTFGSSTSGAVAPQVSGDGAVIGFTLADVCVDANCDIDMTLGEVRGAASVRVGYGTLQLSRNGRWALLTQPAGSGSANGAVPPKFVPTLVDLRTGERVEVPPSPIGALRAVSSDGAVLVGSPGYAIWKQGQTTPLPLPAGYAYGNPALSDDGSTVFLSRIAPAAAIGDMRSQFVAIDLATGAVTVLYEGRDSPQLPLFVAAGRDGKRVLYRVMDHGLRGPAFIANVPAASSTPVPLPEGEFVADAALTGAGDLAVLATTAGRLLKFYITSGVLEMVVPATPACILPGQIGVGGLLRLACSGLADAGDLAGRILIGGHPAAVLSAVASGAVVIQAPWELTTGRADFSLLLPSTSPFESSQKVYVSPITPNFEPFTGDQPKLLPIALFKGDWSGPLSAPPSPGDVMHLYMTGLGAVKLPIATGAPASLTEINPTVAEVTCRLLPGMTELTTLFSGLAPGMTGIYQVSLQAPPDIAAGPVKGLSCSVRTANASASILVAGLL